MPRIYLLLLLSLMIAIAGCDSMHEGLVSVSGTVTIDGEPVKFGQVKISPQGHRAAVGKINEDGTFKLTCFKLNDGAPIGTHLATVTAVEQVGERSNRWHAPMKYASQSQSELWVTIDGPMEDLQIELTWENSGHDGPYLDKF